MKKSEFELIGQLQQALQITLPKGALGIGDDAAIIPQIDGSALLLCTDSLIENVHFSSEHLSAFDLGWKCLAVSLSDIAAMGGKPTAALISLHLPKECSFSVEQIYRGIQECASAWGVAIVGGDTVRSKEFSLVSTVLGALEGKPLLRSAAKPGDKVWLSGEIGLASLGLESFSDDSVAKIWPKRVESFRNALRRPMPQIALGSLLSSMNLASAAIDISDGFLQDALHLATSSGVELLIFENEMPLVSSERLARRAGFLGGDEYQILFTAGAQSTAELQERSKDIGISCIGEVIAGLPEVKIITKEEEQLTAIEFMQVLGANSLGFTHF